MIDATHKLPLKRQAELLDLSRSNVYYLPRPVADADLALMRRIDELHLNFPFAGARMLRDMLKLEGIEQAARAAPDGYTIVMGQTSNLALNTTLNPKLAYDPLRDLQPVSMVASGPLMLVAASGWRLRDLSALLADAKANPGKVMFGSPGNGTLGHLGGELFKARAGIELQHVPYRGASPALIDVLGGRLDLYVSTVPAALGQIRGGKLKGVAVMGLQRHPDLPDVPTVAEAVSPGFEVSNWYGVLVPAATPASIVAQLNAEVVKALDSAEVRDKLAAEGVAPRSSTPDAMAVHIKAEIAKWAPVIKASGVTLE